MKSYNNLLSRSFAGKSITKKLIIKHGFNKVVTNLFLVKGGKLTLETHVLEKAIQYQESGNSKGAFELFSALVGSGTQISFAYFNFATFLSERKVSTGESFDHSLYMALLLKASTMKIFENGKYNSAFVMVMGIGSYRLSCCLLGFIYKSGLFSMNIDIEKSMYYFGESAKKFKGADYNGFPHFVLGIHHLYGITSNQSITSSVISENKSRSKAEEYLLKGIELGSDMCRNFYENIDKILELDE